MKNTGKPKDHYTHTSVSLSQRHIEILKNTATENGLSVNDLMILLLRYVNEHPLIMPNKSGNVKYQNDGINAQILNLYISRRDHERNMDSRRFGKVSVSWLLAYAIDRFLDVVLKKIVDGLAVGIEVLSNYERPQSVLIKKNRKRVKMVSIWYPMRA